MEKFSASAKTVNDNDLMTANEVLIANDLHWKVSESEVYDIEGKHLKDFKAIQREDTRDTFQISKRQYKIIQNWESLSLLDEVVGSGMAKYDKALSFKGGAVVMVRARVQAFDFNVVGDEVGTYIDVVTSHDGSMQTMLRPYSLRLVCLNGMTRREDLRAVGFKHTANYRLRVKEAEGIFARYRETFASQAEAFNALAKEQMNSLQLDSFLNDLLNIKDAEEESLSGRIRNQKQDLERLFVDGIGHNRPGVRGTKWAAYNAVTQYIDHDRATKGDESNRAFSSIFGSGANMRDKAYQLLTV